MITADEGISTDELRLAHLPALGVFSDGFTLVPQVLVALALLLWLKAHARHA